ncbi:MAG: hypothetical protein ABI859_14910 [Pseudomonadota bacterium]
MHKRNFTARTTFLTLAVALLVLPGCKRFTTANCEKPQVYAAAETLPPLRIPGGLDSPNTRAALKIPELNEVEVPRVKGDPCLDEPPRYSNARLLPPEKSDSKAEKKAKRSAPPPPTSVPPAPPPPAR